MRLVYTLVFHFILFPFVNAETGGENISSSDNKSLILQWEVSHPRNTDQISLIFRQKSVELVTNTSSYQKGSVARLGRFESPLNSELKKLKEQVNRYYAHLKKTIPLSSLIKDVRFKPSVDPHVPVLYINEEEIKNGQAYFKPLANIIYTVWEHKWTCVECASYKKKKTSIVRTVKRKKSGSENETGVETKRKLRTSKQRFSRKLLDCTPTGKNEVECVDPQFSIFEI